MLRDATLLKAKRGRQPLRRTRTGLFLSWQILLPAKPPPAGNSQQSDTEKGSYQGSYWFRLRMGGGRFRLRGDSPGNCTGTTRPGMATAWTHCNLEARGSSPRCQRIVHPALQLHDKSGQLTNTNMQGERMRCLTESDAAWVGHRGATANSA